MRLVNISITNYGVYKGENSFDLTTNGGTIVLFGGKNGAGKTTLLNSMRLCLFGARALGAKVSKREYQEYIIKAIHRNKIGKIPLNRASIELEFEYAQSGNVDLYSVNRSWVKTNSKEKIEEHLLLKKNGNIYQDIDEEKWQIFLDDLIPPGIFDLFFFDGEKITSLVIDGLSSDVLAVEIKRLLGLDLVEKLQADLDVYLFQQRKGNMSSEELEKIEKLEYERDQVEEKIEVKQQEIAKINSSINLLSGEIEELEANIHRESSGYALDRNEWQARLIKIESEKIQIHKQIQDLSSGLLPFSLVPELGLQLKEQLDLESQKQKWIASKNVVNPKIDIVRETVSKNNFWSDIQNINSQDKLSITHKISELLDSLTKIPKEIDNIKTRHGFSEDEKSEVLGWLEKSKYEASDQSEELANIYQDLVEERRTVAIALRKIPSDDILRPLVDELNSLFQKKGNLEGQKSQIDKTVKDLEIEFSEAKRIFVKAYLNLKAEEKLERRLELVTKTQNVLKTYLKKQTKRKLKSLEELIVARFRELSRKDNFIKAAKISKENLNISLFDYSNTEIPKEQLSAGEQQMFAIAMMWALRQLSGRPYPVVIDTPLGRLDSDHRDNLVNQYFPHVSHQVILFSTDTEVDKSYFEELQSNISHSYHLEYDSLSGATSVNQGYFWNIGEKHAT
jgi:DNA sulfur modification protein DndD